MAKRYRYRLRDEVVNERYLVEEVYDRELRLAEQYERDKQEEMNALSKALTAQRYRSIDSRTAHMILLVVHFVSTVLQYRL